MTQALDRQALDTIRRVILEEAERLGVRVERVILFGSRARGEAQEESDWDLLMVVRGNPGRVERRSLARSVRWRLAQYNIPADVTVVGLEWRVYSQVPGTILYPARQEGTVIG